MNRSWPQQKAKQVRGSGFLRHVSAGAAFVMLSQGSMRGSVLAALSCRFTLPDDLLCDAEQPRKIGLKNADAPACHGMRWSS